MTNSIVIISLNDLSRTFWKHYLDNPKVRVWQWKTGFPSKEMIDLIDPYAIVLDDYFSKETSKKSDSLIPRLLGISDNRDVYYCSPRFMVDGEHEKFATTDIQCHTFSGEFINRIKPQTRKQEKIA